jgi:acylphosphatase
MNCLDGSVEAIAEGARAKLEELIAWCRHGPSGARVSHVDVSWETPQHAFRSFTIKH